MAGRMCGGLGSSKDADAIINKICDEAKPLIEAELKKTLEIFEAISYKEQVVAGRNYFVKIHIGNEDCIHARIYQPLFEGLQLTGVKTDMSRTDEIVHF